MTEPKPDRLVVKALFEEDVHADRAEIDLVVAGSSFFSGRQALERATEVREVVELLIKQGIEEADIALRDVVAESSKGMFTDSSSARYTLRAVCRKLDRFADVLTAATHPKHTELGAITWKYPEDETLENARLVKALARANAKATVVAEELGVRTCGVHLADFDRIDGGAHPVMYAAAAPKMARARQESASDVLDMSVEHTKRTGYQVRVEYRVEVG